MRLREDKDENSDSEIQHPSTPMRQGQGGVHFPETWSDGWGSDSTARAMEKLRIPETRYPEARDPGGQHAEETTVENG